jgi:hypothetical protein|tara:strand:- start:915 stop:1202 length:288 start_codon:yes stop_codon:yes gene_type:complete
MIYYIWEKVVDVTNLRRRRKNQRKLNHLENDLMKNALLSTLIHVIELAVVVAIALILIKWLGVDTASVQVLIGLVLAALAKFARASNLPIPDYTR